MHIIKSSKTEMADVSGMLLLFPNWSESSEDSRATLPKLNDCLFATLLLCYYRRIPSTSVHFCNIRDKMKTVFPRVRRKPSRS